MMTPEPPITLGHYRHYKGGDYTVVGVVRHSESLEWMVLYESHRDNHSLWVRPYEMFLENVTIDGVVQPRFALITAKEI